MYLDYELLDDPRFSANFVTFDLTGEFFSNSNPSPTPYPIPSMPDVLNVAMIQIFIRFFYLFLIIKFNKIKKKRLYGNLCNVFSVYCKSSF